MVIAKRTRHFANNLDEPSKYYLTTPIYYVNAAPHIGHAYTTIAAETIARIKRMQGYDVVLTSGTDEHGTKVERAASAQGKTPGEFVDLISNEFRALEETRSPDRSVSTHHGDEPRQDRQPLFEECKRTGISIKALTLAFTPL